MAVSIFRKGAFNGNSISIAATGASTIPGLPGNVMGGNGVTYIVCGVMNNNTAVILNGPTSGGGAVAGAFGNGYFLKTYQGNHTTVIGVSQGHPDNPFSWFTVIKD